VARFTLGVGALAVVTLAGEPSLAPHILHRAGWQGRDLGFQVKVTKKIQNFFMYSKYLFVYCGKDSRSQNISFKALN